MRGRWWTIKFSDQPIIYGDRKLRGYADPNTRTIELDEEMRPRKMFRTFCHEVMHTFEVEYSIKIPHALIYKLEAPFEKFVVDNFFKRGRNR